MNVNDRRDKTIVYMMSMTSHKQIDSTDVSSMNLLSNLNLVYKDSGYAVDRQNNNHNILKKQVVNKHVFKKMRLCMCVHLMLCGWCMVQVNLVLLLRRANPTNNTLVQ